VGENDRAGNRVCDHGRNSIPRMTMKTVKRHMSALGSPTVILETYTNRTLTSGPSGGRLHL
jgi:hypothetical protein